jgi:hypothetical protein
VMPTNIVTHNYSDLQDLKTFAVDDDYSDMTNKVTVTGIFPTPTQIIHAEDVVAQVTGSVGWWGEPEVYKVFFSEDHKKRVTNPRLKLISSAQESISFRLAGGIDEYISKEDPYQQYCEVTVKAPNLIPALAVAIGVYFFHSQTTPDLVEGVGVGITTPLGRKLEGVALFAALNILGSIATFQYEIWGQAVGYIDRTLQGSAVDSSNQAFTGHVYERLLEGWMCDSVADCITVAQRELDVMVGQRNRVMITKMTHLQDEEGDVLGVKHPISGQGMITNAVRITRTFTKSKTGELKDAIEGWLV